MYGFQSSTEREVVRPQQSYCNRCVKVRGNAGS